MVSIDLNTCTLPYDAYSLLHEYKTRGLRSTWTTPMQKRFAKESFPKKKSMHSNEHSEKVPKSISEELISKKKIL